jgi:hypothetical protein
MQLLTAGGRLPRLLLHLLQQFSMMTDLSAE